MARDFLCDIDLKAGLLLAGSAGTSGQVLKSQGAGLPPIWGADESGTGGGSVTIGTSAADIFDASGSTITADDAGSDKLVFWDDSAGKLTYLSVGSGLTISGTEITASGGGGGGIDPVITGMIF